MSAAIGRLCALAVFCGAVLCVMPEGGVKRISAVGCTALLLLSVFSAVKALDIASLTPDLARYRELSEELKANAAEQRDRLDRRVIEAEYAAYICDEAAALGCAELHAEVTARWDLSGYWLPYEVRLGGVVDVSARQRLNERIEAALGVPAERIVWEDEG